MKPILSALLWFCITNLFAQNLWQPYYILPRVDGNHIDISNHWQLTHTDRPLDDIQDLPEGDWINVAEPTGVHHALHKAGELPNPYVGMNSLEYEWIENAVWYYRKEVKIPATEGYIFLCFDGIDYFSRVWINQEYLGEHAGMFGGPIIEISSFVNQGKINEIVVEVRSGNYSSNDSIPDMDQYKIIKGWEFTGGLGAEPWYSMGMWRGARLEFVPKINLARPFLFTKKIENGKAILGFKTEIFVNDHSLNHQIHSWEIEGWRGAFKYSSVNFNRFAKEAKVVLSFFKDDELKFKKEFTADLFEDRNWVNETFEIPNPELWWPNGMGKQNIYNVEILLMIDEEEIDVIKVPFGIRKIEQVNTTRPQFSDVWNQWQFVINGEQRFIKGVNWMPADVLLNLPRDEYEWLIAMAKDAGVQMFRVWGPGLLETNEFYDLCNKHGIMVFQDFTISGTTNEWPLDVWEAQVTHNIFRLRNNPALALYNGGNEFNAYGFGNTATIGLLERSLKMFDTTRMFTRTSPDGGSAHAYPDMDPTWYNKPETVGSNPYQHIPEFILDQDKGRRNQTYDYDYQTETCLEHHIRYYQTITGLDQIIGEMMEGLEARGLMENTIIIFGSDHGLLMGEYGMGGKALLYDLTSKIPCFVYNPLVSEEEKGKTVDKLVSSLDIPATILDYAGVAVPKEMSGRSLASLVSGDNDNWREELFLESLFTLRDNPFCEGIRVGDWKYIRMYKGVVNYTEEDVDFVGKPPAFEQLFNLKEDPEEYSNLLGEYDNSEILSRLREKVATYSQNINQQREDYLRSHATLRR